MLLGAQGRQCLLFFDFLRGLGAFVALYRDPALVELGMGPVLVLWWYGGPVVGNAVLIHPFIQISL